MLKRCKLPRRLAHLTCVVVLILDSDQEEFPMRSRRFDLAEATAPPPAFIPSSDPSPSGLSRTPELGPLGLSPSPDPPKLKPRAVILSMPGRCVEKGCVFPAVPGSGGRCLHHSRQQQEPGLYSSLQPSSMLLACGKFGPSRAEVAERRGDLEDRRRLVKEREKFLGE